MKILQQQGWNAAATDHMILDSGHIFGRHSMEADLILTLLSELFKRYILN